MKKTTIVKIITGIVVMTLLFILPAIAGTIESTYTMNGKVTAINEESIYVVDEMGEEWDFEGDNFTKGDEVKIRFFNNGTCDTRYDDIIQNVTRE